jgi:hypothetical protein
MRLPIPSNLTGSGHDEGSWALRSRGDSIVHPRTPSSCALPRVAALDERAGGRRCQRIETVRSWRTVIPGGIVTLSWLRIGRPLDQRVRARPFNAVRARRERNRGELSARDRHASDGLAVITSVTAIVPGDGTPFCCRDRRTSGPPAT